MDINTYLKLKEKYGQYTSWAIWNFEEDSKFRYDLNGRGYMMNGAVKDLQNAKTNKDLENLGIHNKAIIIALNYGERDSKAHKIFQGLNEIKEVEKFTAFHEELDNSKYKGDSRQKVEYKDSILWGAYMTDLIKFNDKGKLTSIEDSNSISEKMDSYINNADFMRIQINGLIEELKLLGVKNPLIFCVGGRVFKQLKMKERAYLLKEQFGEETQLIELPHYSSSSPIARNPIRYHEKVQEALNKIK